MQPQALRKSHLAEFLLALAWHINKGSSEVLMRLMFAILRTESVSLGSFPSLLPKELSVF